MSVWEARRLNPRFSVGVRQSERLVLRVESGGDCDGWRASRGDEHPADNGICDDQKRSSVLVSARPVAVLACLTRSSVHPSPNDGLGH